MLVVLVLAVAIDQASKAVARRALESQPPVYVLGGILTLTYAENTGAFLSLGANLPPLARTALFGGGALVMLAGCIAYVVYGPALGAAQVTGLSLLAGGGAGNLIDRLLHNGAVVDFVLLSAGPLRTGVFNLADVAIMAGLALVLLGSYRSERRPSSDSDGPPLG
jgi:signal peptidase II